MNLLIWQWTTGLQISSGLFLSLFFLSIARNNKRAETRYWLNAWLANLMAVSFATFYWIFQPSSPLYLLFAGFIYPYFKSLFVIFLVAGLARFLGFRRPVMKYQYLLMLAIPFGLGGMFISESLNIMGIYYNVIIILILGFGIFLISSSARPDLSWIVVGFFIRSALGALESYYYFLATLPETKNLELVHSFLSAHSAFDTAAEWCIAIGCVLAIINKDKHELQLSNQKLQETQSQLQELVDKDPLTGLTNRRCLRDILARVQPQGASVLFFDLNNFKLINDRYGHKEGDNALVVFANSLTHCFRSNDHVIRYAGDEFIVVTELVDKDLINQRIEKTQEYLAVRDCHLAQRLTFSVGYTQFDSSSNIDQAIQLADAAMYQNKSVQKRSAKRRLNV